jgi:hypothetical protein
MERDTSAAAAAPRPPRVLGEVPADYSGRLYYRIRATGRSAPRYLQSSPLIFEPADVGQAIATADFVQMAHRASPALFDEQGKLRPQFQAPLKARIRSAVPEQLPEWAIGLFFYQLVSPRVRDVIESFEPDKNIFLAVDCSRKSGEAQRRYLFYVQLDHIASALAFRANGVEPRISDNGNPYWNDWHDHLHANPRFIFLNAEAIGSRKLYYSSHVGVLFAAEVVEALGDVLSEDYAFAPVGVVTEPYDSPAFRDAARVNSGKV